MTFVPPPLFFLKTEHPLSSPAVELMSQGFSSCHPGISPHLFPWPLDYSRLNTTLQKQS